jgi:hypothetical protein
MYSAAASFVSFALLRVAEYFIRERQKQRRQAEEAQKSYLLALKCVITNKELSRQARLDAYDEYKRPGGNSRVDGYVIKFLKDIGE